MRIRWGVSGTGDIINKAVAPAIVEQADSDLMAFYSRTLARAETFAAEFGAKSAYDDFDAFLGDDTIDVVYVGGEVDRHCPETIAAAEAGKHVVCEKPMALDAAECRQMVEACRANDVGLAVAYYRRYYPQVVALKQALESGAIGRPLQASILMAAWYHPAEDDPKYWRVCREGGGGALMDIGSHRLDVLCHLLGEPVRVAGFASNLVHDYQAPDTETLIIEFADGAHGQLRCSWCSGASQDEFQIFGSEGAILTGELEDTRFTIRRRRQPDRIVEVEPTATNRHVPLIDDITRSLLAGRKPRYDGAAGMQASRIMDGCYRSQATRRVVEV